MRLVNVSHTDCGATSEVNNIKGVAVCKYRGRFMKRFYSLLLVIMMLMGISLSGLSANAAQPDNTGVVSDGNNDAETMVVPQIRVTTVDGNGVSLQKANGYVEATITITDTDSSVLTDNILFKVRGNSTANPAIAKKAFTIKFDSKKDVLNMGKAKKWSLLANVFDPTLMRNYIAFDFAQKMELPFTSQQRYVELWVDNSYRGCYVLTEPVEEGSTRVDIDIDSNDGMKDFLIELEMDRVEEDVSYFTTNYMRFAVKEPEEPNDEQLEYISSTVNNIMDVIKSGNREEISKRIDIPSFTRYYLLNELFKTLDFNYSSVFFYYKDGVLYSGPAWDYDLAAGNTSASYSEVSKAAADPTGLFASVRNIYWYLCSCDWFKSEIRETYLQYYDYMYNITSTGGLIDTLNENYGYIYDRNYSDAGWSPSRWWGNLQMEPLDTFSGNVEYLRDWLYTRNVWMSNYYDLHAIAGLRGDVNGDGVVSIMDATLTQYQMAELQSLDGNGLLCGDIDKNGTISIMDTTDIQRFIAEIITDL